MSFFEMTFPPLWKNKNNFPLTGVNKKDPLNEINGITIKSISPRLVLCSRESLAGKESWKRRTEGEGGGEKWHAGRQWETERGHPMNPGIRQFHHACSRSDLPPGTFILPSIREIVATRGSSRLHVSDSFVCRRVIVNVASRASQPASQPAPFPGKETSGEYLRWPCFSNSLLTAQFLENFFRFLPFSWYISRLDRSLRLFEQLVGQGIFKVTVVSV